jgi:hypothetical protein
MRSIRVADRARPINPFGHMKIAADFGQRVGARERPIWGQGDDFGSLEAVMDLGGGVFIRYWMSLLPQAVSV